MDIQSVFAVNGVAIDLANETLRDASGNPIVLRPQCFAVLRHLIENADHLVTKDALMSAVWPDTAVTDDSLVQCIHEIREAKPGEGWAVRRLHSRCWRSGENPSPPRCGGWRGGANTTSDPRRAAAGGEGVLVHASSATHL